MEEPSPEDIDIMAVLTKLYCEDVRPKVLKYMEMLEKQTSVDVQGIDQGATRQQENLVDVTPAQGIAGAVPNDKCGGSK